jgi:multicomponent Na+:H+ antiporter subunit D
LIKMQGVITGVSMVLVVAAMAGVAAARGPSRGAGRAALILFCALGQLGSALAALGSGMGAGLEIAVRQVLSAGAALIILVVSLGVLGRGERAAGASRIGLPTLALAAGVCSLAGLPPTDGFFAKLLIYESGIRSGGFAGRLIVALVALLNLIWLVRGTELVSCARRMEKSDGLVMTRKGEALVLVALMCLIVGGGLFPGIFWEAWRLIVPRR